MRNIKVPPRHAMDPHKNMGHWDCPSDACLALSRLSVVSMCDLFVSVEVACHHYLHGGRKEAYLAETVAES